SAVLWSVLAARSVRVERRTREGAAIVGEPFDERFTVRRQGFLPAPWVEILDHGTIPGYQPGRVISLGRSPVVWMAQGVHRKRGWVGLGPTTARARDPFGIWASEVRLAGRHSLLVHPRIEQLPELSLPAAHHSGLAERLGNWADYPPEVGGVRDYAPGDAMSRIHWGLSHKHGRLMSKTFEQPMTADLWLVLDLERRAHWGEAPDSTVDCAVTVAASIAAQIVKRGRKVGLVASDARGTLVDMASDAHGDRALLDYLAVAEASGSRPLASARVWDRMRQLDRRAVVVVTPSADTSWISPARTLRERGGALIVFYIDAQTFGAPEPDRGFDLGADVDLYVVRRGDDLSRLVRTRDAIRFV
ncbi:MAG: DUF58 domain-containing protein, partial [Candidatus Dormibacteraceae bacterium]